VAGIFIIPIQHRRRVDERLGAFKAERLFNFWHDAVMGDLFCSHKSQKRQQQRHIMAGKKQSDKSYRRLKRVVSIAEMAERAIEPMVQKRGFANSELLLRWSMIVSPPFDKGVVPDKLNWPRDEGDTAHQGAVLTVRVDPVHALAFTHETETIKAAINRYFGFYLVDKIKPSRRPFVPSLEPRNTPKLRALTENEEQSLAAEVEAIDDPELREALMKLGRGLKGRD
jgi:hypothetical protein